MSTIINSYFENNSGPVTGLTPTIRIWDVDGAGQTLIVGAPNGTGLNVDGTMAEVDDGTSQDGFYKYEFTAGLGFDTTRTYLARVDGGNTLQNQFRYQVVRFDPNTNLGSDEVADAVWDAAAGDHNTPGTMGEYQNNIEIIRTVDIPALFNLIDLLRKYETNRTRIDTTANTLTIYDDDCTTPLRVFRLLDNSATPSVADVCERTPSLGLGSTDGQTEC